MTAPVGDDIDADVVLASLEDAGLPLLGIVLPVGDGGASEAKRLAAVSAAMAVGAPYARQAVARGIPVWVLGPHAGVVVAWLWENGGHAMVSSAVEPSELLAPPRRRVVAARRVVTWLRRVRRGEAP